MLSALHAFQFFPSSNQLATPGNKSRKRVSSQITQVCTALDEAHNAGDEEEKEEGSQKVLKPWTRKEDRMVVIQRHCFPLSQEFCRVESLRCASAQNAVDITPWYEVCGSRSSPGQKVFGTFRYLTFS